MEVPGNTQPESKKGLLFVEAGLSEVILVILMLVIFFGLLNFFNILSLSRLYPSQLGWLPHLNQTIKALPKTKPVNNLAPVSIMGGGTDIVGCPVQNICQEGILISGTDPQINFCGLSYNTGSNIPLLAAFPGILSVENRFLGGQAFNVLVLRNKELDFSAFYVFDSSNFKLTKTSVAEGETIATLNGNKINVFGNNYSFVFYLKRYNDIKSGYLKLKPSENGKGLDNIL